MSWYQDNENLLIDVKDSISRLGQPLRIRFVCGQLQIVGTWKIHHQGEEIDSYHIKIVFPDNYPVELPRVFETGNRIPRSRDRHLTPHRDWEACLFVSTARWEVWPIGASLYEFFSGPVTDFFISQSYFDAYGVWPFGDYFHGADGQIQYLRKKLNLTTKIPIEPVLNFLIDDNYSETAKCPCRSGMKVSSCHHKEIGLLRANISKEEFIKIRNDVRPNISKLKKVSNIRSPFRKFIR